MAGPSKIVQGPLDLQKLGANPAPEARESVPTDTELKQQLCDEPEKSRNPAFSESEWKMIISHRGANRAFRTEQFSESFLAGILGLSLQQGREVGLVWDAKEKEFTAGWGSADSLKASNATIQLTIIHTHPRATLDSMPLTLHSLNDLQSVVIFATAQNRPALSTVVGKVCGGKMEMSSILVEKDKIFVANVFEKKLIDGNLNNPFPHGFEEVMKDRGIRKFSVEVNPQKIQDEAKRVKIPAYVEQGMLNHLKIISNHSP